MLLFLFDYFRKHKSLLFVLLGILTTMLCVRVCQLDYKEDITDFLPVDADYREAMQIYQQTTAGDRIVLQFSFADTTVVNQPLLVEAIERYGFLLAEQDTAHWVSDWQPQIDYSQVSEVFAFIYEHLPYFLTEDDYLRADSLWATNPDFLSDRLQSVYQQTTSLSASFLLPMLQHDPLNLGARLPFALQQFQPQSHFSPYEGYIFTPDRKRALVTITTPFGGSETNDNARLLGLLQAVGTTLSLEPAFSQVNVHLMGAPVIAVSNAAQIKHDSILALLISAVLILALLLFAFRSLHALWQIVLSTGFGFLFALGFLSLFRDSISLIVLGVASMIIGIAVNYPLHYICHLQHQPDRRLSLQELTAPLCIGNITTVGAFLTLVPLDAVAIRDLGIFSALMLVGTILFVLLVLPHIAVTRHRIDRIRMQSIEADQHLSEPWTRRLAGSPWVLVVLLIVTGFLGYHSSRTEFDSDFRNINYMTEQQRDDLNRIAPLHGQSQGHAVYIAVSGQNADEASSGMESVGPVIDRLVGRSLLQHGINPVVFLPSASTQQSRLAMWHAFWQRHGFEGTLSAGFVEEAQALGFSPDAFAPFASLLRDSLPLLTWDDFQPLTSSILSTTCRDGSMVATYTVTAPSAVETVEEELRQYIHAQPSSPWRIHVFDIASLNSRVTQSLSDNFNYIGLACATIVFLFLWLSFRRFELAVLAFLPMAIGWIWILGLMHLFGIQFNIVNIILATFIFGQGDDYTIFITEGLVREYREGRRILFSYQRSILLSALIMLIGIGTLIFAQHPAMHSLAQVTIIGMFVVVLMSWFIPPILFHWLIRYDRSLRTYLLKQ